jgi:hypothetical protein
MRYCQDLLSRDRKAGVHQLMDEKYHPYVRSQMKKPDGQYYIKNPQLRVRVVPELSGFLNWRRVLAS